MKNMKPPEATTTSTPASRADLYDTLAQVLDDPAMLAGLPGESLLAEAVIGGAAALGSATCRRILFALEELPPVAGQELRQRLERVTARPDHRPLAFYESLATTGQLVGPPGQEAAAIYRQWGLEADGDLPDAASVELAFLAFLAQEEARAEAEGAAGQVRALRNAQRGFLQGHAMHWLPQLGRALAASGDPYFALLGQLLEGFLKEEQLRLLTPRAGVSKADIPFVVSGNLCSLCGFCVQTCPTRALWIGETDAETSLLFNPARCIGCAKCLPVCPEDALHMARRDGAAGPLALQRSQRAHCPRCGAPTVSQAELDAVFARLDADPHLRQRLSLCNRCKNF